MWEHLSHHVLRGDVLSSSCCHVRVALGQLKAHFPQEEPAVILLPLHRGTFFSPTSLLNAAETPVAIRMPGLSQGSIVPAGDTAGHPVCSGHSYTLGQSRQEPWAGLPDTGMEQWFDLWSISKESSILLTGFKVMCVLYHLFPLSLCSLISGCCFSLLPLFAFPLLL